MKKYFISGPMLAKCREKAGYTQTELANELGIGRVTLTNWEGKSTVSITKDQIDSIEKLLKVNTNELTNVIPEAGKLDILDHPVIRSLVEQSEYIMNRVRELETENKLLKSQKKS